jgi:hypothetical protein
MFIDRVSGRDDNGLPLWAEILQKNDPSLIALMLAQYFNLVVEHAPIS